MHCSDIVLHCYYSFALLLFLPQAVTCMQLLAFTMCTHVRLSRAGVQLKKEQKELGLLHLISENTNLDKTDIFGGSVEILK